MTTGLVTLDAWPIRRSLERAIGAPWQTEPFGPDGIKLWHRGPRSSVIVTCADYESVEWIHASIAHPDQLPTYGELVALKEAVFGPDRFAFQIFPPRSEHVSIHNYALHLWGRVDGESPLPHFGAFGTI